MFWRTRTTVVTLADAAQVADVLGDVAGLRRWLDGVEVACARRLRQLAVGDPGVFPEQIIATATGTSLRRAAVAVQRAATCDAVLEIGAALSAGSISGQHVDAVTAALAGLEPAQRATLIARGAYLATLAAASTVDGFRRQVTSLMHQILADAGIAKLERQRRAVRLRTWVDRHTGMVRLLGDLDPQTGAALITRLDDRVNTLFHDQTPELCPSDPVARQDFLRALALLDLINGDSGPGTVEMYITIDLQTIVHGHHQKSRVDFGVDGIDLPLDTIRRISMWADIVPVLLDQDGVVLKLGRTRRLASPAQRRALRAMYRTCAIPSCSRPVRQCEPHHCDEWDLHCGLTDIELLVPICKHHHDVIHAKGWTLTLAADRSLTVNDRTGSTIMTTGPPCHQWQ